jgi:hypothetical protein
VRKPRGVRFSKRRGKLRSLEFSPLRVISIAPFILFLPIDSAIDPKKGELRRPTQKYSSRFSRMKAEEGIAMRKAAMLCLFALLSAAVVLAQTSGTSSTQTQTQSPSSQNQSATNPQSPTTPVGSAPAPTTPTTDPTGQLPANPAPSQTAPATDPNAAQPPASVSTTAPSGADQAPANTEMHAALDTPLSTKTSKAGDRFTATISDPVRGSSGAVIIPAGSRVEGEVAESEQGKAVAALRGKGKLSLRFRDIVLPSGQTLPFTATLVSVNNTNGKNTKRADEEGQVQSGTQGKDVAKDVGIGAGIGTVAGLIFGGPLKGLAIGALAGGGYVLATKGKDVELPAQTGMVIRLDQPLRANPTSGQVPR